MVQHRFATSSADQGIHVLGIGRNPSGNDWYGCLKGINQSRASSDLQRATGLHTMDGNHDVLLMFCAKNDEELPSPSLKEVGFIWIIDLVDNHMVYKGRGCITLLIAIIRS